MVRAVISAAAAAAEKTPARRGRKLVQCIMMDDLEEQRKATNERKT